MRKSLNIRGSYVAGFGGFVGGACIHMPYMLHWLSWGGFNPFPTNKIPISMKYPTVPTVHLCCHSWNLQKNNGQEMGLDIHVSIRYQANFEITYHHLYRWFSHWNLHFSRGHFPATFDEGMVMTILRAPYGKRVAHPTTFCLGVSTYPWLVVIYY